jgi:hypothetical protein
MTQELLLRQAVIVVIDVPYWAEKVNQTYPFSTGRKPPEII